jgi:hypothetical protein
MEQPPKLWTRLFLLLCRKDLVEEIQGDLEEIYDQKFQESPRKARSWYRREVLNLIRPRLIQSFHFQSNMSHLFMNFLKVAWRNARRHKVYTSLNLLGLVAGITSSLIILMWVYDEVKKDKFHSNGDRIYSVLRNMQRSSGDIITTSYSPFPVVDVLEREYPEIERVAAISWPIEYKIMYKTHESFEQGLFVTEGFYDVFSYNMLAGRPTEVGIVISERLAKKLSIEGGDLRALIGQRIDFYDGWASEITGIIQDPGPTSSLTFDWLLSGETFVKMNPWLKSWDNGGSRVYFVANDDQQKTVDAIEQRILGEIETHTDNTTGETLWIQAFEDGYLYNNYENGFVAGGRIEYVRLLSIVAILIILIASVNFINLTTAQTQRRAREIGLRKVLGSKHRDIAYQFLLEFSLMVVVAVLVSLVIIYGTMPYINELTNKDLHYLITTSEIWYLILSLTAIIILLSASYPVMKLTSLTPRTAVSGGVHTVKEKMIFRNSLIVFQLCISFILIFGSLVIYRQLDYMLQKDTGIKRTNVLAIPIESRLYANLTAFKAGLLSIPGVEAVTGSSGNPIRYQRSTSSAKWEGKDPNEPAEINIITVDEQFIEHMEIEVLEGRAFDFKNYGQSDSLNYMINEAAAALMGYTEPLGKKLSVWGDEGEVIGLVKDYHFSNFSEPVAPLIIKAAPDDMNWALVHYTGGNVAMILDQVNELILQLEPEHSLRFELLEDTYRNLFNEEITLSKFAVFFVLISLIISVIGLYGLSSFQTEKRSREMSIRKVFGASSGGILMKLYKEYAVLFLIACAMAIPAGLYFSSTWLSQFVYRIDVTVGYAIWCSLLLLAIGIVSISYQTFRVARNNPVDTLKME